MVDATGGTDRRGPADRRSRSPRRARAWWSPSTSGIWSRARSAAERFRGAEGGAGRCPRRAGPADRPRITGRGVGRVSRRRCSTCTRPGPGGAHAGGQPGARARRAAPSRRPGPEAGSCTPPRCPPRRRPSWCSGWATPARAYRRYLEHRLRDEFGFAGVPIRMSFRPRHRKPPRPRRARRPPRRATARLGPEPSGRGAAWLARLTGGQEVGSSNLPGPTAECADGGRRDPLHATGPRDEPEALCAPGSRTVQSAGSLPALRGSAVGADDVGGRRRST